jgi:hypothetical protein
MYKEKIPTDKKPILSDYLKNKVFYMDNNKADEFDNLIHSFLTLLVLNHGLYIEVSEKENYSVDFFANTENKTCVVMRINSIFEWEVGYWRLTQFNVYVSKDSTLKIKDSVNINSNFRLTDLSDVYCFDAQYDEQGMLDIIRYLVDVS